MNTYINNVSKSNVPVKCYGDYLDDLKMMFSCDGMILNAKGIPIVRDGNSFHFEVMEYGTRVFRYMVEVVCEGQKFGILYYSPRNIQQNRDLVQFRFDNALFYTVSRFDIRERYKRLLNWLQLEFTSVSKMDLCLDYPDSSGITETLIRGILNGDFRISGREKELKPFSTTKNGVVTYTGLHVGKRSNPRFLRVYNKSNEMRKVERKEYIVDLWRMNNLEGEIWRYEYSLSSKFFKDVKDLKLDDVFDRDWQLSIVELARYNHFDIKLNTGKSEVNKEKSINFMAFDVVRRCVKSVFRSVTRLKRTIKESLIGQKRIIKGLLRSYVSNFQDSRYLSPIKAYIQQYQLKEWFYQKLGLYLHEFRKAQIVKGFDYQQFIKDFESC